MNKESQKNNTLWKSILKALKRRLKIRYVLFIALLLIGNTFAWFIYMDKISSDIDVKIKSWNVSFQFDNQNMTDYINFSVDEIYPGMTPYSESLSVTNDGEVDARLTYEIVSIQVLDDFYTTENSSLTETQLRTIMQENYPFTITITTNQQVITADGGNAMFYINVNWPYESVNTLGQSNDELDTYWGKEAYDFMEDNPGTPCIRVRVKLSAIQIENNNSNSNSNEPENNNSND